MSKEPYALPAHYIMNNTRYLSSSVTIQAVIWLIVWCIWREGFARALTDQQMHRIASVNNSQWDRYKDDIKAILADALPLLQKAYEKVDKAKKTHRHYADKAREAYKRQSIVRKLANQSKFTASDLDCALPEFTPVFSENTHNSLKSDLTKRNEILAQPKPSTQKQFTDS